MGGEGEGERGEGGGGEGGGEGGVGGGGGQTPAGSSAAAAVSVVAEARWGLGWGLEPEFARFFQWGKMIGMRAFVMGNSESNSGFVVFANCNTGLRLIQPLADILLPGEHPAVHLLLKEVTE